MDDLSALETNIATAFAAQPHNPADVELKGWTTLTFAPHMQDNLAEFAAQAVDAVPAGRVFRDANRQE